MSTSTDTPTEETARGGITLKQHRLIHKLLVDTGLVPDTRDRDAVHEIAGMILGRDVDSMRRITSEEAGRLIDELVTDAEENAHVAVHVAMARVARDIGLKGVGKTGVNTDQHYRFRGIDDIVNALSPVLARHGVVVLPSVASSDTREKPTRSGGVQFFTEVAIDWVFVGPQGDTLSARTIGLGADTSDKAANKAMTAAYKYMLGQVFAIPYVGFDEADLTTPHESVGQEENRGQNDRAIARLREIAAMRNITADELTVRYRTANGNMTWEQFCDQPAARMNAYMAQVEQHLATIQQQAQTPPPPPPADESNGYQ